MGKAKAPKAPDLTGYTAVAKEQAELGYKASQEQLAWAKEMWGEQKGLLEQVLGPQVKILEEQYANGMKDRQRYETLYQPLEENLIKEFQSYDTPERRSQMAGRAQAQVAAAQSGQREAAQARLESYGIDPSQTRSAALDRGLAAQQAAQQAAAGNVERTNVENTGRALRAEAINIGRGYPSQVAGAYGQSLNAGNAAMGNMNGTVGAGAQTMGTGLQWGQYGMGATGMGANIANSGFRNQLDLYNAKNAQGSPWDMLSSIGGAWAGSGFKMGNAEGGEPGPDSRPAGPTDTVPAALPTGHQVLLTPGEFIFPVDVTEHYGKQKLRKMIEKAREEMGIPEKPNRVQHPKDSRQVAPQRPMAGMAVGGSVPYSIGDEYDQYGVSVDASEGIPPNSRNPYEQQRSPSQAYKAYQQYAGQAGGAPATAIAAPAEGATGFGAAAGTEAAAAQAAALAEAQAASLAAAQGGAAAGGSAAGGGGVGGAVGGAGPWIALAAAIAANEKSGVKSGDRASGVGERALDLFTGKSMSRDWEGKWNPKLDKLTKGKWSDLGLDAEMGMFTDYMRPEKMVKNMKNTPVGKAFSKIKNIFD